MHVSRFCGGYNDKGDVVQRGDAVQRGDMARGIWWGYCTNPPPPMDRMTDVCENITFPQLCWPALTTRKTQNMYTETAKCHSAILLTSLLVMEFPTSSGSAPVPTFSDPTLPCL